VDTSLVWPAVCGAVPADDPRTRATLHRVIETLTDDEYAYRYEIDGRPLGSAEGAFLLCGFMVSMALAQQGDLVGAARWFERNRSACGSPGLFTEEYDVTERQLRGNLPQAFVHAAMLHASVYVPAS
jgi:GH15 family glucan-1,4-alpha-glucosidase